MAEVTTISGIDSEGASTKTQIAFMSDVATKASEVGISFDDILVKFAGNAVDIEYKKDGKTEVYTATMKVAKQFIENGFVSQEEVEQAWMSEFDDAVVAAGLDATDIPEKEIKAAMKADEDATEAGERLAQMVIDKRAAEAKAAEEAAAEAKKKADEEKKAKEQAIKDAKLADQLESDIKRSVTKDLVAMAKKEQKGSLEYNQSRLGKGGIFFTDMSRMETLAKVRKDSDLSSVRKYTEYIQSVIPDHKERGITLNKTEINDSATAYRGWVDQFKGDYTSLAFTSPFTLDPVSKGKLDESREIKVVEVDVSKLTILAQYVNPDNAGVLLGFGYYFPRQVIREFSRVFDVEKDNAAELILDYLNWFDPADFNKKDGDDDREVKPTKLTDQSALDAFLEMKELVDPSDKPATKNLKINKKTFESIYARVYNEFKNIYRMGKGAEAEFNDDVLVSHLLSMFDPRRVADGVNVGLDNMLDTAVELNILSLDQAATYNQNVINPGSNSSEGEEPEGEDEPEEPAEE